MTMMVETTIYGLSDRGSIPLTSIRRKELNTLFIRVLSSFYISKKEFGRQAGRHSYVYQYMYEYVKISFIHLLREIRGFIRSDIQTIR